MCSCKCSTERATQVLWMKFSIEYNNLLALLAVCIVWRLRGGNWRKDGDKNPHRKVSRGLHLKTCNFQCWVNIVQNMRDMEMFSELYMFCSSKWQWQSNLRWPVLHSMHTLLWSSHIHSLSPHPPGTDQSLVKTIITHVTTRVYGYIFLYYTDCAPSLCIANYKSWNK